MQNESNNNHKETDFIDGVGREAKDVSGDSDEVAGMQLQGALADIAHCVRQLEGGLAWLGCEAAWKQGEFREQLTSEVLTKRTGEHTGSDFDHVLLVHGQTREGLLPIVAQFFIAERGQIYFLIDTLIGSIRF